MRLYHFTSAHYLEAIKRDGQLRRTDSMLSVNSALSMSFPTVVWLLDVDAVEHDHGLSGSVVDKTEIRITVETDDRWTKRWLDFARAQGIEQHWLDAVVTRGGGMDAAEHWYVSFKRIPRSQWLEVKNVKTGEVIDVDAGM